MQINFHQVGGGHLYLYYPVILIGISVALLFNPLRIFYFRTRMWLLYSLVSTVDSTHNSLTDSLLVALITRWCIPCRVARLLLGRHVLFFNLQHERKTHLLP
jgi:hypothetical protein